MRALISGRKAILSAYSSIILPASTFAMAPVLFARLETRSVAGVFVALSIARILGAVDFGIIGLAIPRAAEIARADHSGLAIDLWRSMARLATMTVFWVAAAIFISMAGTRLPGMVEPSASMTLLVGAPIVALTYQSMSLVVGTMYATRRFRALAIGSSLGALVYVAAIVVGLDESRPWWVLVATTAQNAVVSAIGLLSIRFSAKRTSSKLPGEASSIEGSKIATGSGAMQLIGIGAVVLGQGPIVAAALFLNPVAITAVGVAQQYSSIVRLAGSSLASYFLTVLSGLPDPVERCQTALWLHRRWVAVCLAGGLASASLARPLVRAWLGDETPPQAVVCCAIAALSAALVVSTAIADSYQRTTGDLLPELFFVVSLLFALAVATTVAAFRSSATSLWAALAVGTVVCALIFDKWFDSRTVRRIRHLD